MHASQCQNASSCTQLCFPKNKNAIHYVKSEPIFNLLEPLEQHLPSLSLAETACPLQQDPIL